MTAKKKKKRAAAEPGAGRYCDLSNRVRLQDVANMLGMTVRNMQQRFIASGTVQRRDDRRYVLGETMRACIEEIKRQDRAPDNRAQYQSELLRIQVEAKTRDAKVRSGELLEWTEAAALITGVIVAARGVLATMPVRYEQRYPDHEGAEFIQAEITRALAELEGAEFPAAVADTVGAAVQVLGADRTNSSK